MEKIAVVGLGGVGGYVGCLLANQYENVSFVVRGQRGQRVSEQGMLLKSDYRGEHLVHPKAVVADASELPVQDLIILCVKNYSLEEACQSLKHCVDDHTVIVPIMNGADPGDRVRSYLGKGLVLDSLIYIVAFKDGDTILQKGNFANVQLGKEKPDASEMEKIRKVVDLMNGAGVDCSWQEDIQAAIWRKYILNCAYNVETAYYNCPIGPLREDPEKAKQYEALVGEAYAVCLAKNINVVQKDIDHIIWRFYYDHASDASSSLQRDMGAGVRPTELETFCGYIVKEGERLGVPTPVMSGMYEEMKLR